VGCDIRRKARATEAPTPRRGGGTNAEMHHNPRGLTCRKREIDGLINEIGGTILTANQHDYKILSSLLAGKRGHPPLTVYALAGKSEQFVHVDPDSSSPLVSMCTGGCPSIIQGEIVHCGSEADSKEREK